ncbi:GDYXXLXY domain-containing protein [Alkalihalobacillus sp. BA299]|uniref:GDYXXLXY domain-containing protein n=1 Tax=Alkalihalobacillus sp. BA299 TaxID=2815938 RepID=UPI0035AC1C82
MILQFSILGYQVWQSEQVLSKGTLIKLELQPIYPRSLFTYRVNKLNHKLDKRVYSNY